MSKRINSSNQQFGDETFN
jgi:magnesium-transporting ATPase (P-type)